MDIIRTKHLNQIQKKDGIELSRICQKHDHMSLSLPMEEACIYYLLYQGKTLLSVFCGFCMDKQNYECSGFTHPLHRKKGYFTRLLKEFLKEAGDQELIFLVDESCKDTVETLRAMEASFWYEEFFMELSMSQFLQTAKREGNASLHDPSLSMTSLSENGSNRYIFSLNGTPIGSCSLHMVGHRTYFYGFEIAKAYRNRGLGNACFSLFLEQYQWERLFLQVSSLNTPAITIYKKAGFQVTERLAYYVY